MTAKGLEYGDRMKLDPAWSVVSTGGGFTGWSKPLDPAQPFPGGTSWLIVGTDGGYEGSAPPESGRHPCGLYL